MTKQVNLLIDHLDKYIQINTEQPILQQALAQGIFLARECQTGRCGKCRLQLVSGDIIQAEQSALTPTELEQGAVLICCATAKSDLVLSSD